MVSLVIQVTLFLQSTVEMGPQETVSFSMCIPISAVAASLRSCFFSYILRVITWSSAVNPNKGINDCYYRITYIQTVIRIYGKDSDQWKWETKNKEKKIQRHEHIIL